MTNKSVQFVFLLLQCVFTMSSWPLSFWCVIAKYHSIKFISYNYSNRCNNCTLGCSISLQHPWIKSIYYMLKYGWEDFWCSGNSGLRKLNHSWVQEPALILFPWWEENLPSSKTKLNQVFYTLLKQHSALHIFNHPCIKSATSHR